jgi:NTE family protein
MSNVELERPERILVLSGGGGRGGYQVGVCEVLAHLDQPWIPDLITGNSIGATNGAILAAPKPAGQPWGTRVELLKKVWVEEIAGNKLHRVSGEWPVLLRLVMHWAISVMQGIQKPPTRSNPTEDALDELVAYLVDDLPQGASEKGLLAADDAIRGFFTRLKDAIVVGLSKPSVMDRQNWTKLLERHVDLDHLNSCLDCPYLGVTAIKAANGELGYVWNRVPPGVRVMSSTGIEVKHIMASSSIPGFYEATEVGLIHWWDGALAANTPIAPAIDVLLHNLPAKTEIVVVLMTPYGEVTVDGGVTVPGPPPTVLDALQRFLDWMMLAALYKELERLDEEQRSWVKVIAPKEFMGVVQMIDYGELDVDMLIELGKQDAASKLT